MKKLVYLSFSTVCLAFLSSCAARTQLLDAEIISMSSDKMPGSGAKRGPEVNTKWCRDEDEPVIPSEDKVYGLIDQVVAKAEKESGASYLAAVSIYAEGSCIFLSGYTLNK